MKTINLITWIKKQRLTPLEKHICAILDSFKIETDGDVSNSYIIDGLRYCKYYYNENKLRISNNNFIFL